MVQIPLEKQIKHVESRLSGMKMNNLQNSANYEIEWNIWNSLNHFANIIKSQKEVGENKGI